MSLPMEPRYTEPELVYSEPEQSGCGCSKHSLYELRTAAQAVVDRWHTPLWKDVEATGAVINRLEKALESRR